MSDNYLRRYIDMDQYQYNLKKQRKGYAKVDIRDDRCKIYIYVNDVQLKPEEVLKAYAFKYDKGAMIVVPLGTLEIKNSIGQIKMTTSRQKVMDSTYTMDDLSGIIVLKKDYFTEEPKIDFSYGGAWDKDIRINLDNIKEYGKEIKYKENVHRHQQFENEVAVDEKSEPTNVKIDVKTEKTVIERPRIDESEVEEPEFEEPEMERSEIEEPEMDESEIEEPEIERPEFEEETPLLEDEDVVDLTEEPYGQDPELQGQGDKENHVTSLNSSTYKGQSYDDLYYKAKEYQKRRKPYGKDPYRKKSDSVFKDHTPPEELLKKQFDEQELSELHEKMFEEYPKMAPFERCDQIMDCIRIEPKDIAALPINIWTLMNNTFLLNGYHQYKHLVLIKEEDDTSETGYKFILGVPGIYHKKDRFMAYLYGFSHFRCCTDTYAKPGEYGYWTIDIGKHM
jgi:hypothetical protein